MPTHFYKVVYDPVNQDAIAFLVPHRKISKSDLPVFIVSVDEVEWGRGVWGRLCIYALRIDESLIM